VINRVCEYLQGKPTNASRLSFYYDALSDYMSSLMMVLVRRNMLEYLTKHKNKVIILMNLLVFFEDIYQNLTPKTVCGPAAIHGLTLHNIVYTTVIFPQVREQTPQAIKVINRS
jgi:hypothetical protein